MRFPTDAPKERVLRALRALGFEMVREREHISLRRVDMDGRETPMTLPNQRIIKRSTLRRACAVAGISRDEFLRAYEQA